MATRSSPGLLMAAAAAIRTGLTNGMIEFYSNAQSANARSPITGTIIGRATLNGGAWAAGSPTNGLTFAAPVLSGNNALLAKPSGELWQFTCIAAGTIASARYYSNVADANADSTTLMRLDGAVSGPSGSGEVKMAKTTYAVGEVGDIQSWNLTLTDALPAV